MKALNLDQVITLRRLLEEAGAGTIHMHDACGAQYFSLEGATSDTASIIENFVAGQKLKVSFNITGDGFSILQK